MKTDDFEKRLQQVAPREVPSAWREEVLTAAEVAQSVRHPSTAARSGFLSTLIHQLATLIRLRRAAWAGLGGVWMVILVFNLSERDHSALAQAHNPSPPSPEALAAWHAQRRELAALADPHPPREIESPKNRLPQPRSNRRAETIAV
jgi:uncharacterized protein YjiS (DUF1127 family)